MAVYGGHWFTAYDEFDCPNCGERHIVTATKCRKCGLDFTVKDDSSISSKNGEENEV